MRAGIAVDSLGVSQLAVCLISELNKLNQLDKYVDIMVFYHRYDSIIKSPHFAILPEIEMWGYSAPVMSTCLQSTHTLFSCPTPPKKFFYVWDLEWTHNTYDVEYLASIYCHKDISLVARSKDHYNIIKNCWKEPVAILEDFKYERLVEILIG